MCNLQLICNERQFSKWSTCDLAMYFHVHTRGASKCVKRVLLCQIIYEGSQTNPLKTRHPLIRFKVIPQAHQNPKTYRGSSSFKYYTHICESSSHKGYLLPQTSFVKSFMRLAKLRTSCSNCQQSAFLDHGTAQSVSSKYPITNDYAINQFHQSATFKAILTPFISSSTNRAYTIAISLYHGHLRMPPCVALSTLNISTNKWESNLYMQLCLVRPSFICKITSHIYWTTFKGFHLQFTLCCLRASSTGEFTSSRSKFTSG